MARYRGSVCRICRRENQKLFLKGERCLTEKCSYERRSFPPGQHGHGRIKFSEYAMQLREKQKLKRLYGLAEKQFRSYFTTAEKTTGVTGENLLSLLERRLDNVAYRMNLAGSRAQARQLVKHGHVTVNGKKVNVPSFTVKKGDEVSIIDKSKKVVAIEACIEAGKTKTMPNWIDINYDEKKGMIKEMPTRDDVTDPIEERLVVELYSK